MLRFLNKKINIILVLFLFAAGLFLAGSVSAEVAEKLVPEIDAVAENNIEAVAETDSVLTEQIDNFEVEVKVNSDATINVKEKIVYNFADLERHGIYRNIPTKYIKTGYRYEYKISDIDVTDDSGVPYNFVKSNQGDYLQIKIGDADILINGIKTYIITYKIDRALNYFKDFDELYWNMTGDEWEVPIVTSSALVILPANINQSDLRVSCYFGSEGSTDQCAQPALSYRDNQTYLSFPTPGYLESYSGLTVAVGWPKNLVYSPSLGRQILYSVGDNWILLFPIIAFVTLYILWRKYGRDPKNNKPIIAQYDIPDNLSPLAVGTVYDNYVQNGDLSAEIVQLAIKGYLKISKTKKGLIDDYLFEKLKDYSDLTNDYDSELLDGIFAGGEKRYLSDCGVAAGKKFESARTCAYDRVVEDKYYVSDPNNLRSTYLILGSVCMMFGMSSFGITGSFVWTWPLSFFLVGVELIVFSFLMPKKTVKGVDCKNYIKGLRLYLEVAEKARIKFHNAPAKNPATFEKFLPYAMVLGVEKQWAKKFEGIYKTPPTWYSYSGSDSFSLVGLTSSLNSFSTSTGAALAPSSSGSGGGGSSGGGGGGGGGGSW